MNTYPITAINETHECQHMRTIVRNNNYPTRKHQRKHKSNPTEQNTPPKQPKMGHLHVRRERNQNLHTTVYIPTAFRTTNTIRNL
jgi:hypothetical protein